MIEDAEGGAPSVSASGVEMLVEDAQRLRDKLIESGAASLLDGRLAGACRRGGLTGLLQLGRGVI